MSEIWRKPLLFVLFFVSLWFYGCNSGTVENLSGVGNLSSLSVIQGLVYSDSLRYSKSLVSTGVVTGTTQSSFVALDIALQSESGTLIQKKSFATRQADGGYSFSFEGLFPREPIRLVIYDSDQALEIALGTPDQKVVEVEISDFYAFALATRWLEQTSTYSEIRSLSFAQIKKTLLPLAESLKQAPGELIQNYHRLGVNSSGKLQIMDTTYDPVLYRAPKKKLAWESMQDEGIPILTEVQSVDPSPVSTKATEPSTEETDTVEVIETNPIMSRTNLLDAAFLKATPQDILLYRPWSQLGEQYAKTSIVRFEVVLRLNKAIGPEMEAILLQDAHFLVTQGMRTIKIPLVSLMPTFSDKEVTLLIRPNDWDLNYGAVIFVLNQSARQIDPLRDDYLFAKMQLELGL
ncbi:MAG: hypothetical protein H3C47_03550 [Candidatus Cloacimonetes bacterium]|nr:hypothetical protein [Candidatus Cloacimonadota bacterium]